ncbi:coiled-coil protein [Campylobacter coli]|nr:coiled-coil protein [Campylobacter coli]
MPVSPIGNMNLLIKIWLIQLHKQAMSLQRRFAATLNMAEFNEKEKTLNKLEKVNETHEIKEEIKEKPNKKKKRKTQSRS